MCGEGYHIFCQNFRNIYVRSATHEKPHMKIYLFLPKGRTSNTLLSWFSINFTRVPSVLGKSTVVNLPPANMEHDSQASPPSEYHFYFPFSGRFKIEHQPRYTLWLPMTDLFYICDRSNDCTHYLEGLVCADILFLLSKPLQP